MKIKRIRCLFFLLIFCSIASSAQKEKDNYAYADSIMQSEYKAGAPGAVLLIAKDGYPVFEKAYGLANMELQILNRPGYEFEIGSNTKQFTAVSILQLVQQGKINLQDDIHKYLPDYNTHGRQITIINLLTHTSGIPDPTNQSSFLKKQMTDEPRDTIIKWCGLPPLLFTPGSDWSYSNGGFFLLGRIIEKVSGMSYEDYVQKNIFDPLHMDHSYFGTHDKIIPGLVTGYAYAGDGKFKDAEYISWSWPYAAGEIISNADDLLKWDNALYTDKVVNRALLQKAWANHTLEDGTKTQYGYGWFSNHDNGVEMIWHAGGIPGFVSMTVRLPEQHLYVTLLSNNENSNVMAIALVIALHSAGHPVIRPRTIKPDSNLLKNYVGAYKLHALWASLVSDFGTGEMYNYVTQNKDTLFIQTTGGHKAPLTAIAKDVFISSGTGINSLFYTTYHFVRDAQGRVNVIKVKAPLNIFIERTQLKTDHPSPE